MKVRLPPEVEERLIEAREAALDGLGRVLAERGGREFTVEESRRHFDLIRRVASIDAARSGYGFAALLPHQIA